jgi:hypothetical protein
LKAICETQVKPTYLFLEVVEIMGTVICGYLLIATAPFVANGWEDLLRARARHTGEDWCSVPKALEKRVLLEQAIKGLKLSPILYPGSWSLRQSTSAYVSDYCPWLVIELHCRTEGGANQTRSYLHSFKIRLRQKNEPRLPIGL